MSQPVADPAVLVPFSSLFPNWQDDPHFPSVEEIEREEAQIEAEARKAADDATRGVYETAMRIQKGKAIERELSDNPGAFLTDEEGRTIDAIPINEYPDANTTVRRTNYLFCKWLDDGILVIKLYDSNKRFVSFEVLTTSVNGDDGKRHAATIVHCDKPNHRTSSSRGAALATRTVLELLTHPVTADLHKESAISIDVQSSVAINALWKVGFHPNPDHDKRSARVPLDPPNPDAPVIVIDLGEVVIKIQKNLNENKNWDDGLTPDEKSAVDKRQAALAHPFTFHLDTDVDWKSVGFGSISQTLARINDDRATADDVFFIDQAGVISMEMDAAKGVEDSTAHAILNTAGAISVLRGAYRYEADCENISRIFQTIVLDYLIPCISANRENEVYTIPGLLPYNEKPVAKPPAHPNAARPLPPLPLLGKK